MLGTALFVALQITNTQCTPMGGTVFCQSQGQQGYQQPPPITQVDVAGAYRAAQEARARNQAIQQTAQASAPPAQDVGWSSFQTELARRMGILARQHRCEDAYRLAALAGEPEFADESRRLCPF